MRCEPILVMLQDIAIDDTIVWSIFFRASSERKKLLGNFNSNTNLGLT